MCDIQIFQPFSERDDGHLFLRDHRLSSRIAHSITALPQSQLLA